MPVASLDPNVALIVIDLQKGLVGLPTVHLMQRVIAVTAELAATFRHHARPLVLVNVDGAPPGRTERGTNLAELPPGWTDLLPELDPGSNDLKVTKRTWGAFTGTDLETRLRMSNTTQVVVAGIATSMGVESTARQAHELGFNVTLALDAMTDLSQEAHDNSVTRIFPRLGETGSALDIANLLARL